MSCIRKPEACVHLHSSIQSNSPDEDASIVQEKSLRPGKSKKKKFIIFHRLV